MDILKKAKNYVNKLLLPLDNHYYHQYNHALEVMQRAIYLGKKENLSDEDIEILGIAGIFHDTGFIIQYDNNEVFWAKIAKNFLQSVLYSTNKIKQVEQLILATKPNYKTPKNILEKIIKDADLDNLGREDFLENTEKLKQEIETIKEIKIKDTDWKHGTLCLLDEHKYYTLAQKEERENKKQENKFILSEMIQELEEEEKMELRKYL